jgi:hypothetical protein
MSLFTDRPPTAADAWAPETRNVALPGTRDAAGEPRVVSIRRLAPALIYMLRDEPADGVDAFTNRLDEYRKWAEAAVVEPQFSFNGSGPVPRWDDLPVAAQMAIAGAIAAFTTEGMEEVTAVVAAFRGGKPGGGEAGAAGGGLGNPEPDAPGEPPAPAAGDEPSPATSPGA